MVWQMSIEVNILHKCLVFLSGRNLNVFVPLIIERNYMKYIAMFSHLNLLPCLSNLKLERMSFLSIPRDVIIWILLFCQPQLETVHFVLLLTEATRSGVEEYEQIEVDETAGPGPQRCRCFLSLSICQNLFCLR